MKTIRSWAIRLPSCGSGVSDSERCAYSCMSAPSGDRVVMVNYLMQTNVLSLSPEEAGKHVPFYWGGAMVGRFNRRLSAAYLLARQSAGVRRRSGDRVAPHFAKLRRPSPVGRFSRSASATPSCSRRFFRWRAKGLGQRAAEGSGIICMAIVGVRLYL